MNLIQELIIAQRELNKVFKDHIYKNGSLEKQLTLEKKIAQLERQIIMENK